MARKFWAVGITVRPTIGGGWTGHVDVSDDYFADSRAAHIHITTYVLTSMEAAIDSVKASAEELGIEWSKSPISPRLFMHKDGEGDIDYPEGWREELQREAERIGWTTYPSKEPA